ncbi:MAG: hypothetical protein A2418_01985 [Candidatus Brennerbacteria bacterium RIFOXYC1_FULL_41_11]|uniref:Uncharacterized protein n=1 Tax=Candidatus Brennerbacteria bacterium RIFOXYD1_FULL_41_16 TaxID=1797529 RepID=A0A1G1XLA8_9BACT|nr:MAG: hypothetical protein UU61_C0010G0002 [Parcubacteria group bacterium GW2011_GWB1_41_4]OGY39616.1 MAG: hypothetical protein A2391_01340 [Candidatus Brennerbacteria bacterium RIFOXYB1_FULL_41_13]OGY39921.1 MAG: hypothetical protein A2418_01985 [Candidatus Brennerbacteria bacterium RIFOXYC1_FULL_41_11]OGY40732.1 MAG: hypothetical protein A2570_01200 [Candidatus Brennerbacteria bacterium RIFOXYD1_FULL_41_16]
MNQQNDKEEILNHLFKLIESGDQKQMEDFIVANFNDLPEDLKRDIVLSSLNQQIGGYLENKKREAEARENALLGLADALEELGYGNE